MDVMSITRRRHPAQLLAQSAPASHQASALEISRLLRHELTRPGQMSSEKLAFRMRELEEALECGGRITSEAAKILSDCAATLGAYSSKTAPIRDRARTLTTASRNIRQARERCDQIATSLDMSRRLQSTIQHGPAQNMEAFLAAVDELEAANTVLWSNQSLSCVKEAITHSEKLWNDAMLACESDYAVTLTKGGKILSREMLAEGVEKGEMEVVTASYVPRLQVLSKAMLKGAHQRAIKVYSDLRSEVMDKMLKDMGLNTGAYPELQIMSLEQLEEKIKRWIEMVSALVIVLSAEKSLVRQIFAESSSDGIFSQVVNGVLIRVASFGRDILKTSHTPQKLFSLLDMHQALEHVSLLNASWHGHERCRVQVLNALEVVVTDTPCWVQHQSLGNLLKEIETASGVLFDAFQNSVKEDSSKKEVQDGTVHPLTAGTLTFFKRLFKHSNFMKVLYGSSASLAQSSQFQIGNNMSSSMVRILMILQVCLENFPHLMLQKRVLQDNLEAKSRSYKSKALAHFFLMNNVNFIVTSVEQSKALELLGQPWVDRQKDIVQDYAGQYHAITWEPLIRGLDTEADDVTQNNFQRRKSAIKERFKTFNTSFEEIHTTQMEWIIPDPDLKKIVRDKVIQSVIPAYELFYDTFKHANFTKNPEKYLKYKVVDIERMIREDLFENKFPFKEQQRRLLL